MSLILFWSAVLLIVYIFLLFPALTILRGLLFYKPFQQADITPNVSIVIAAYNEEKNIRARIENILSLDYPKEKIEVLIASDGSTDETDEMVSQYGEKNIRLLSLSRQGKYAALNAAIPATTGEILVFSDANSIYAPNAIRALVCNFADLNIGGVAGNQTYLTDTGNRKSGIGERSYWNFDQAQKEFQSRAGSVTSATGSIYAIRRSLYQPVPAGIADDFFISTGVIAQGYRLVYAADAISYEPVAESSKLEFVRKVRYIMQGLYGVWARRALLNPFRYGLYAIQLFSHKALRRWAVFPFLIFFLASPFLWNQGSFYQAVTLAQAGFFSLSFTGWLLEKTNLGRIKIFSLPFFFCVIYTASLVATLKLLSGSRIYIWETQRQTSASASAALQTTPERKLQNDV